MTRITTIVGLLSSALLTGCAGIPSDVGAEAASNDISARAGADVQYSAGAEESEEVRARIVELLAQPITLESAAELALLRNRRVQAALAKAEVAVSAIVRARTQGNPSLSAKWMVPMSGGGNAALGLGVSTSVVDLLFMSARVESASQFARAATHDAAATVLTIAERAQRALVVAATTAQVAALADQELAISAAAGQLARELRAAGNVPDGVVLRAAEREQADRLAASSAHSDAEAALASLARAIGLTGNEAKGLRVADIGTVPEHSWLASNDVSKLAVERSVALSAQHARVMALLSGQTEADAKAWLFGLSVGVEADFSEGGDSALGPALGLDIPLFGRDDSASRALAARIIEASEEYLAMATDIRSVARELWPELRSRLARHELATGPGLAAAQRVLTEVITQHNAMQVGIFEVLDARRGVAQAERREVLARREAWMAWLDVKGLATGAPPDLARSRSSTSSESTSTNGPAGH